jgi:hypothetical protein
MDLSWSGNASQLHKYKWVRAGSYKIQASYTGATEPLPLGVVCFAANGSLAPQSSCAVDVWPGPPHTFVTTVPPAAALSFAVGQQLAFTVNAYDANNNSAWMTPQYSLPRQLELSVSALASQQSSSLVRVVGEAVAGTGAVPGSLSITSEFVSSRVPGQLQVVVAPTMPGVYTIRAENTTSFVTSQADSSVKHYFSPAPYNTFQINVLQSSASAAASAAVIIAGRTVQAGGFTAINVTIRDASGLPLLDVSPLLLGIRVISQRGNVVPGQQIVVRSRLPFRSPA